MSQATQSQITSLANLRRLDASCAPADMRAGFDTVGGFELMQRAAKLFAASNIVPPNYRDNVANCVIAVDMAMRMGANPLMVMQNLYLVHNRPAWSAKFLIATVNKCGRFTALRYEFQGEEGTDEWGCRAVATELATGEKLVGPLITIGLAKKEGWYSKQSKDGNAASKWPTMPELMLRYRAASWFVSAYAPELAMGLQTVEEVKDTYDMEPSPEGGYRIVTDEIRRNEPAAPEEPAVSAEKSAPLKKRSAGPKEAPAQEPASEIDAETGEVFDDPFSEKASGPAAGLVTCPKNGKRVDELECVGKPCHDGCPEFS